MNTATLPFSGAINTSLQIGDMIYYSTPTSGGPGSGIQTVTDGNIYQLGIVTFIGGSTITVVYDDVNVSLPLAGDYIMFEKNKEVNSSSIKGYYAEVEFKNYSTEDVELFSIGSEVSESSR